MAIIKGALRQNRPGEKKKASICRPPIGGEMVTGKAGLTIGASLWGPAPVAP